MRSWKRMIDTLLAAATTALVVGLSSNVAIAADPFGKVTGVLNNVVSSLTGPLGHVIAVLSIIAVGVMCMFGQMDIKRMFLVMGGIGLVFGAAEVASALGA
jgi:type IV secretion system protein VirB2